MGACGYPLTRTTDGPCESCGQELGWGSANHIARYDHPFVGAIIATCGHDEAEHEPGPTGFSTCKPCREGDCHDYHIHPFVGDNTSA